MRAFKAASTAVTSNAILLVRPVMLASLAGSVGVSALVIAAATASKFGGAMLGGRLARLPWREAFALGADGVHHLVAFLPALGQLQNDFGRVLQISIYDDNRLTT